MTHPDLEGQEIAVAPSAVPVHAESGWQVVPGQDETGDEWPAEVQRFEGQPPIRLRHPDLEQEITVAESAVPFHREKGWLPVDDEGEPEPAGDLEGLTVEQLRDLVRARGLPVSGTKAELVERLSPQASEPAEAAEQTPEEE
jgi:hypothetical protein